MSERLEGVKEVAINTIGADGGIVTYNLFEDKFFDPYFETPTLLKADVGVISVAASGATFLLRETASAVGRSIEGIKMYDRFDHNVRGRILAAIDIASSLGINVLRIYIETEIAKRIGFVPGLESFLGMHILANGLLSIRDVRKGRTRLGVTNEM